MYIIDEHSFRMARPPARVVREMKQAITAREHEAFRDRQVSWQHRRVVENAMIERLYGTEPFDRRVTSSLEALETIANPWRPILHNHGASPLPQPFQMHPGLNVIGPPYDFTVTVALGSQRPAAMASSASGRFSLVGTAGSGRSFHGSASVCLFIVPSHPSKTLSIRPYFEYQYSFSCESHGPPTAHSHGSISAEVSGHLAHVPKGFPGKAQWLWTGSSDAWDDQAGSDANTWRNPDCELRVSGFEYYTVNYSCQADGDSNKNLFGWSISYVTLNCRVPFIVIEEF